MFPDGDFEPRRNNIAIFGRAVARIFHIFLLLSNHKAFLTAWDGVKYRPRLCSQGRKFFGIPVFHAIRLS